MMMMCVIDAYGVPLQGLEEFEEEQKGHEWMGLMSEHKEWMGAVVVGGEEREWWWGWERGEGRGAGGIREKEKMIYKSRSITVVRVHDVHSKNLLEQQASIRNLPTMRVSYCISLIHIPTPHPSIQPLTYSSQLHTLHLLSPSSPYAKSSTTFLPLTPLPPVARLPYHDPSSSEIVSH